MILQYAPACPSTVECYHILAAKMYLGMDEDAGKQKKINLTQLRRNSRKRKSKKSGRKIPRIGDCDVYPAPDAATSFINEQGKRLNLINTFGMMTVLQMIIPCLQNTPLT